MPTLIELKQNIKIQMKKNFYLVFSIFPLFTIAQNTIELPASYFLDQTSPRTKPCLIKKLINYNMYLNVNHDSIKQFNDEVQLKYYEKLLESEVVNLNTGNYHFENKDVNFSFSINERGFINGESNYSELKNNDYQSVFTFLNGVLIKTKTIISSENQLYSQTALNDSILTEELFYKSGKLKEKATEYFRIKEYQKNTIRTIYYENGSIDSYSNTIDGIYKSFYNNGKLSRHTDDKIGFGKFYEENGILESQYYKKGDEFCKEYYNNGLLNGKQTSNKKESKEYFYENGKIIYYEVFDLETKQRKVFDSKNKLIPGKTIPRVSIGF
jgi:hypothetical protein